MSIAAAPQKTVYTEGETFDPAGMAVQAKWSDGSVTDVTGEVSYRTEPLTTDVTSVEISYTSGDVTKTVSLSVQVNPKVTVTGVLLNPSEIELYPGDVKTFGVSVQGTGNPSQAVTWSVEGASSSQTVIDENGRLTVGEDETAGQLTVKAQATADAAQVGQAAVTVAQKESGEPGAVTDEPAEGGEPTAPEGTDGEYTSTDLKDETAGVSVNGAFSADASFTVTSVGAETEEYQTLVKEAEGKTILGVYELTLDGTVKEESKIQVTFTLDEQYNGKSILILHYPRKDDISYIERYVTNAQDGTVTVEVDSLSPFVIALNEESAVNDGADGQTPDDSSGPETEGEPGVTEEPVANGTLESVNGIVENGTGSTANSGETDTTDTSGGSSVTGNAGGTAVPANTDSQNSDSAAQGKDGSQVKAAPRTGDTASPVLWIVLVIVAAAAVIAAIVLKKTRK